MRHQDRLCALLAQVIDRRQTFTHPGVVGNDDRAVTFFGRDVEIDADQDAPAAHVEITQG